MALLIEQHADAADYVKNDHLDFAIPCGLEGRSYQTYQTSGFGIDSETETRFGR